METSWVSSITCRAKQSQDQAIQEQYQHGAVGSVAQPRAIRKLILSESKGTILHVIAHSSALLERILHDDEGQARVELSTTLKRGHEPNVVSKRGHEVLSGSMRACTSQ